MSTALASTILDTIPFRVNRERLLKRVKMDETSPFLDDLGRIADAADGIAKPKGLYRLSTVAAVDGDRVLMDGVEFTSRVLSVNLEGLHRAFPFVATCGLELEDWSTTLADPLERFWADTIKEMAVYAALQELGEHLVRTYEPGKRATMNPGSLPDWPMSEQKHLFALFGQATAGIGVTLSESFLMNPMKSVSGLWFETEKEFQNCQLCPRADCPNRQAPYDEHLFAREFRK